MSAADAAPGTTAPGTTVPGTTVPGDATSGTARRGVLQVVGRLGWGVADQGVSSLSNFALSFYVARTFGASGFGAFSLAYVTYSVVLNAARGCATDPLLVRYSGAVRKRWRRATSAASATALGVGIASGALCVLFGLVTPAPTGPAFVALGVGLPGLALQDSWRFAFFAGHRAASALLNDVIWSALLVAALFWVHSAGSPSIVRCLLAFGGTASVSAVVGAFQAGVVPAPARVRGWLHEHRTLSARYLVENVSASGATQIRSFVLGGVAGLASVGYLRTAELLMGPFLVVLMGVSQVAVPEAARVLRATPDRLARFCLALGGVQGAAALLWGVTLMLVLPHGIGRLLLKDLWTPSSRLVPAVTLGVTCACLSTAATAGLRAMGIARRSLRAQITASVIYLIGGTVGALLAGVLGAAWGVMAAQALGAGVWWWQLRAALADRARPTGDVR